MKHISKKLLTILLASSLAVNGAMITSISSSAAEGTKYEMESGTVTGDSTVESDSTASGGSFVFLKTGGDVASVTVPVESTGMYSISVCYSSPYGDKIQNLYVNDVDQGQCSFQETAATDWTELALGSVKLTAGDNTIAFKSSWGWTNFDYITVQEATLPTISASDTTCCDSSATSKTQNLMSYLSSVYGNNIISGQQEIYKYGPHDFDYEFNYIQNLTGELPAIRGFDYLNCNPLYGSEDGTTDRIIDWVNNKNGIATSSWHITVPKDFDSYTLGASVDWASSTYVPKETNFDPSKILEEGSKEYDYYMLCLKGLAAQLTELQDADVPLIFRPLHEAEGSGGESGSWFWWGKAGSAVYKELWKLTYETLTETYGLHNLIWEWNSYAYSTSANWYPGDEYVDLIAYDKYNCTDWSTGNAVLVHNDSAISSTFYSIMDMYKSKKMVAMSENDSIPTLENLTTEKAGWLYFCPWYDGGSDSTNFLSNPIFNDPDDLTEMYQSDYCITLDELPTDLYTSQSISTGTKPSVTTTSNEGSETTETTETTSNSGTASTTTGEKKFELVKYDLTDLVPGETVSVNLEGTPNASTNGCFGYINAADPDADPLTGWVSKEWEGQYDADGNLTITFVVPDSVTAGEFQIWWAGLWNEETEKNGYADSAMVDYTMSGATTTESSTTTETADTTTETTATTATTATSSDDVSTETSESATTTASEEPAEVLYGDVNLDGKVDLTDAILLNKAVADQVKLSAAAVANSDCYVDGTTNGDDSITLLRFLVKLIDSLPVK